MAAVKWNSLDRKDRAALTRALLRAPRGGGGDDRSTARSQPGPPATEEMGRFLRFFPRVEKQQVIWFCIISRPATGLE